MNDDGMLKELKKSSAYGSGTSGMLVGDKVHQTVVESKTDRYISENAGWGRLIKYYKPCWMNIILTILAMFNAFSFTFQALFVGAYQYLYTNWYEPDVIEDPVFLRNAITITFLCEIVFMTFIAGTERYLFMYMGENLTYKLRLELLTSILYKQVS